MAGVKYDIPPEPADPASTVYLDAGEIRIGIEYRDTDAEQLRQLYASEAEQLASFERLDADGFTDEGVSLHVVDASNDHEYLRFDLFDTGPHYHYIHRRGPGETIVNHVVDYDVVAHGDMLDWAIDRLATNLAPMLREAGATALADAVDPARVHLILDEVGRRAQEAREIHRRRAASRLPSAGETT